MNVCIAYRVCLCYCCIRLRSLFYHFRYWFWCRGLFWGQSLWQLGIRIRFRGVSHWVLRLDPVGFIFVYVFERREIMIQFLWYSIFEILWYLVILGACVHIWYFWELTITLILYIWCFALGSSFLEKVYLKNFESYFPLYNIWFEKLSKEF